MSNIVPQAGQGWCQKHEELGGTEGCVDSRCTRLRCRHPGLGGVVKFQCGPLLRLNNGR